MAQMTRRVQLAPEQKIVNIKLMLEKYKVKQGTKLYSPIWGDCTFEKIDNSLIVVKSKGETMCFDSYGHYNPYGTECLLFPSETNRDWEDFECSLQKDHLDSIEALVKNAIKHKYGIESDESENAVKRFGVQVRSWADGYRQALLDMENKKQ